MKSILYALFIILFLSGCAGFSNKMVMGNKKTVSDFNLKTFEGLYALFPDSSYDKKGKPQLIETLESKSMYNLNYFVKSHKAKYDYSESYTVELKAAGQNRMKFITQKDNVKIDSIELGGELKKDGFFYLDNTYLKSNGVPYLAGGYTNYKTRIGLTKDNGLLVHYAYDNSGALLFMFWAGSTYNLGYHYKKIENK
ncbi:hypothetical protein [Flavobacterium sp. 270]|uniref:hypothetical protein n=1 Tax=Flavobacterium sp. 270 TaxID=2512114 RepID=UPI00106628AA|nr:hypothetical protein [Flavobacterium sp. 270]